MSGAERRGEHDARDAYEGFAPFYDAFTAHHDYEAWTRDLEALARDAGVRGEGRLLDVACGTGKSFLPFLERGWEVTACDLSPAMAARAAAKAGSRAVVEVHDMRALPVLGSFDLVLCLDDALNYLTEPGELVAALRGMRSNLAPDGVLVFDLNTIRTYREAFASLDVMATEELVIVWRGEAGPGFAAGGLASALTQVLHRSADGWRESAQRHRQRHHPGPEVRAALRAAGLEPAAIRGMEPGGAVVDDVDELHCTKAIYAVTPTGQAPAPAGPAGAHARRS